MPRVRSLVPFERIAQSIHVIRGQKVLLDQDLGVLYGVETRVLVQAVKRNSDRFPSDFMFRLTAREFASLKSQSVMSSAGAAAWGGRRKLPYGFTEQGVAMLSSVLNSPRAIRVNIEIMRAFVQMRQVLRSHADLSLRLDELELRFDGQFRIVFDAIRQLMIPPDPPKRRIGFQHDSHELP
jgi:hypothetical protein